MKKNFKDIDIFAGIEQKNGQHEGHGLLGSLLGREAQGLEVGGEAAGLEGGHVGVGGVGCDAVTTCAELTG